MAAQIVKTEYKIELTIDQMLNVLQKDRANNLCSVLRAIPGVVKAMYDSEFGPVIYVTVENDTENSDTWQRITATIDEFCSQDFELDSISADDKLKAEIKVALESSKPPAADKEFVLWVDGSVYEIIIRPLNIVEI